jgi:hypothetical protein
MNLDYRYCSKQSLYCNMEIISLELSWFCDIIITSTFHKTTSNTLHNWQFHRIDILFRFFLQNDNLFYLTPPKSKSSMGREDK